MKNLDNIVDKIERHIDEKDKIREKALRSSREIIIRCRKAILSSLYEPKGDEDV